MQSIIKQRESNMELLRIISMFLVLVVHADFLSLGIPTSKDLATDSVQTFGRFFFEALAIGCVNVFVLISGWFGMHASLKGLCKLLFQCLFFTIGIFFFFLVLGKAKFDSNTLIEWFFLDKSYWFIKTYLCLYLISPILNAFIEKATPKVFRTVLIALFLYICLYGWLFDATKDIAKGYSIISFIGLYLLARYAKLYLCKLSQLNKYTDLSIFIGSALVITALAMLGIYFQNKNLTNMMFWYSNPLVVLGSMTLLLYFSKLKIDSKLINLVAKSSFAVYLLHCNSNILIDHYAPFVKNLYKTYSGIEFLGYTFGFMVAVFVLAILIDQFRIFNWNKGLSSLFENKKDSFKE